MVAVLYSVFDGCVARLCGCFARHGYNGDMLVVACRWMAGLNVPMMVAVGAERPAVTFRRLEAPSLEDLEKRSTFMNQLQVLADIMPAVYVKSFAASPKQKRQKRQKSLSDPATPLRAGDDRSSAGDKSPESSPPPLGGSIMSSQISMNSLLGTLH